MLMQHTLLTHTLNTCVHVLSYPANITNSLFFLLLSLLSLLSVLLFILLVTADVLIGLWHMLLGWLEYQRGSKKHDPGMHFSYPFRVPVSLSGWIFHTIVRGRFQQSGMHPIHSAAPQITSLHH